MTASFCLEQSLEVRRKEKNKKNANLRPCVGDGGTVEIGDRTNVQDLACLHCDPHAPLKIGNDVSIGHGAGEAI